MNKSKKDKDAESQEIEILSTSAPLIKELFDLIEKSRQGAVKFVNSQLTILFWQVGFKVNTHILNNQRAEYGKSIVASISAHLIAKYGRNFEVRNLRRMIQFSEVFPDIEIVTTLSSQLSWSHFILLFPLKKVEQKAFYAKKILAENWSVRETKKQIEHKVFERTLIAKETEPAEIKTGGGVFKDPYFFDFLGLDSSYLEKDLESAILQELEQFILELGKGFSFVERQKRMVVDGEDFYLDLLFFHRKLKRLVAIELKIGKFKPSFKGQMEFYLKWLNKYERQEWEEAPIGLILCAEKNSEQIELLEMHRDGIMVAEYWTDLPAKEEIEKRLHLALERAKERIEIRKLIE